MMPEPGDEYQERGPPEPAGGPVFAPPYQRRLSVVERIFRLLVAPKDAMEDISLAPDYLGVVVIISVMTIVSAASILTALGKMQFVGTNAAEITSLLNSSIALTILLVPVVFVIRWLVKSLLVKYACNNGSNWTFAAAASVTGYAYLVGIIVGLIGVFVVAFFIPSVVIDTTDLEVAIAQLDSYQLQIASIQILYTIPISIIELVWKSYLGGLGAHLGTRKMCSFGQGIAIFLALGGIGLILSLFA